MEPVVLIGTVVLLVLSTIVLARLFRTHKANINLYRSLRDAYDDLEQKNRQTLDRTARLEQLNDELEAVQTELVRSNRELVESKSVWERLAITDTMTEIANRRAFLDRLREEIARAQRYNYPFVLLMLDVDNFKFYNDTFGHPAGDQVLREIVAVMRENVREGDLVARYGGEEFAALLPQTDTRPGRIVAERIRAAVERHTFANRDVTVSIGAAEFSVNGPDAETLINNVDKALYAAKRGGRNRVMFSNEMQVRA